MKYPKCNKFLSFEDHGEFYKIKNVLTKEEWESSPVFVRFLQSLDGKTNPYELLEKENINNENIEQFLKDIPEGMLEDKTIKVCDGTIVVPVWIPKVTNTLRVFASIWNLILMIASIPVFVMGVYILFNYPWTVVERNYGILFGLVLGIGSGMVLHELSKAFSCIGYSSQNQFWELGVMIFILPSIYALYDYSQMSNRLKKAQINAAGIESNIFLSGLFFSALSIEVFDSQALIIAAFINFFFIILNITLVDGSDCLDIIRELVATSDEYEFVEHAKAIILSKEMKMTLRKRGIDGIATIAACYIIVGTQLIEPIFFLICLGSVIELISIGIF